MCRARVKGYTCFEVLLGLLLLVKTVYWTLQPSGTVLHLSPESGCGSQRFRVFNPVGYAF